MTKDEQIKMLKEQRAVLRASNEKFRKEFVNKACAWLEKYMESLGYIDEWCRNGEDAFRKAMAEKAGLTMEERKDHYENCDCDDCIFQGRSCAMFRQDEKCEEFVSYTTKRKVESSLFDECLAKVNPDIRAEVRKNMDAALTWHKASEELPPIDIEVICKMEGVLYTKHFVCKWDGRHWWHWADVGQGIQGWFGLNRGWEVIEWKEI